jgi:hypothetical protein
VLAGGLTLAFVLVLLKQSAAIFDAPPASGAYSTVVSIWAEGASETSAVAARDAARARILTFAAKRGFAGDDVRVRKPMDVDFDQRSQTYLAEQQVEIYSTSYAKVARTSNSVEPELDPSGKTITASFPSGTFVPLSLAVAIGCLILLAVAVAGLETREADVSHAPRGMHPVVVGAQTFLYGFLTALAVADGHLLAPPARIPFVLVSLVGIGLLATWLWKSRSWWQQSTFLRVAWVVYACALAGVISAAGWALAQPLT